MNKFAMIIAVFAASAAPLDGLGTGAGKLHDILDSYGIANTFGTHTSAAAVRFQNFVLPFFSKNLCAGKNCM